MYTVDNVKPDTRGYINEPVCRQYVLDIIN